MKKENIKNRELSTMSELETDEKSNELDTVSNEFCQVKNPEKIDRNAKLILSALKVEINKNLGVKLSYQLFYPRIIKCDCC